MFPRRGGAIYRIGPKPRLRDLIFRVPESVEVVITETEGGETRVEVFWRGCSLQPLLKWGLLKTPESSGEATALPPTSLTNQEPHGTV